MRVVLIGDGESPHLLKWANALASQGGVDLWVASSTGFLKGFDRALPHARRLTFATGARHAAMLRGLPALGAWLSKLDADWLLPHYLTSHGALAWLAKRGWRLRARISGSAWGSDILVTPTISPLHRWLTRRVLRACTLTTSDSIHMADSMRQLGAREVMSFPFGLESLPAPPTAKQPWLFFANRGLEPLYRPHRVIQLFARIATAQRQARLVVANNGSCSAALKKMAIDMGMSDRIDFVGRLDAETQATHYARAQWFLSQPKSDSVSVSVLEAMAHGCIPILSDLPANRELVRDGENGAVVRDDTEVDMNEMQGLLTRASQIAAANRDWIAEHALFAPSVARFVARLVELDSASPAAPP